MGYDEKVHRPVVPAHKEMYKKYASDVAFLLWGSNPWTNPMQAADWADRKIAQLVSEGELEPRASDSSTPAPKSDQVKGSKKNPKGSASGKSGGISFSDST